jgi:hypothetical protein
VWDSAASRAADPERDPRGCGGPRIVPAGSNAKSGDHLPVTEVWARPSRYGEGVHFAVDECRLRAFIAVLVGTWDPYSNKPLG